MEGGDTEKIEENDAEKQKLDAEKDHSQWKEILQAKIKELELKDHIHKENVIAHEKRTKEAEQKVKNLEDRIRSLGEREQRIAEKEKQLAEKEKEIEEKQKELDVKLGKWEEIEENMQINSAKLSSVVHLNVGGTRYSVYKKDLLKHKGSLLEAMVTSQHSQQLDNGELFIDRDGQQFRPIQQYLRTGQARYPLDQQDRSDLDNEFDFFRLPSPISVRFYPRLSEGILTSEQQTLISTWLPNKRFYLRYKASNDGFSAESFHKHVDNRLHTLAIIRTTQGFLFGGYASLPWESVRGFKYQTDCFLFTLLNPHQLSPTRFFLKQDSKRSLWCSPSDLVSFGNGDIHVNSDSNKNASSYFAFPYSYQDSAGKGMFTFTGSQYFTTDEIEVYSVEN